MKEQSPEHQSQNFFKILENLEHEGNKAYSNTEKRNKRNLSQVICSLEELQYKLEKLNFKTANLTLPPVALQKLYALTRLDQTRQKLQKKETELIKRDRILRERTQVKIKRYHQEIDSIIREIAQINDNTNPESALNQLKLIFLQEVNPIEDEIPGLGIDIL